MSEAHMPVSSGILAGGERVVAVRPGRLSRLNITHEQKGPGWRHCAKFRQGGTREVLETNGPSSHTATELKVSA